MLNPSTILPQHRSQRSMTKEERRDLQEKQRALKLAQKRLAGTSTTSGTLNPGTNSYTKSKLKETSKSTLAKEPSEPSGVDECAGGTEISRGLRIFSHFGLPKLASHAPKGEVHPEIVRLGLLLSDFQICGANARCIAALTAFKKVIQDYKTPTHNTLSRHLMTHLSPQITHLVSARPMSVTMGNAIRQLKLEISNSDIDITEQDAKDTLCQKIDNYVRDRIIMADEVIQDLAGKKINDDDVILTFARSSVIEKIFLRAQAEGKRFSVIIVDSRPLLEGKELLKRLIDTIPPIPCTYAFLSALPSLITDVTSVFLGAHSLSANGSVYSRAGTAMVAMLAKNHSVPVVVCCETHKFSEGVMLDGFGKNELVPSKYCKPTKKSQALAPNASLEILNPLYDLTPPTYITAVVTEVGLIPPNSINSIPLALGKTGV